MAERISKAELTVVADHLQKIFHSMQESGDGFFHALHYAETLVVMLIMLGIKPENDEKVLEFFKKRVGEKLKTGREIEGHTWLQ